MNRTIALLFGLSLVLPAQAQSIADALEQAWSRHPLAASSVARTAEAEAQGDVAASMTPGPASLSLSSLNDRLGKNRGQQEWEIEVEVPLWMPGQRAARIAEATGIKDEVSARRHALRWQIAGEVRDAWWSVAAARGVRALALRRVASANELEADVLRRFKAGDLARVDANLAQNERLAAQAELADSESALLHAEQSYRGLTGLAAPAALPAERSVTPREPGPEHPQLISVAAGAQLARARLRLAEASRRDSPELGVSMSRERGDFGEPYSNKVGVKLTIPFSSGPRVRQGNAAARAELAQAEAELALAQLKLTLDSERTRLELDTAERQLVMAGQRRELSADTLALAEKSFALGESDLATLLRARDAAFEAEAFFHRQEVTLAASRSRLNQVLGALP